MKQKIQRWTSALVILSLIVNGFIFGDLAHADTICIPTVTNSTSLGITNFTLGSINNTTPTPSGQGGVTYNNYTNDFAPVLVTKGDFVNYSLTYSPSSLIYFSLFTWLDNSNYNSDAVGNLFSSPTAGTVPIQSFYSSGLVTLRVITSTAPYTGPGSFSLCSADDGEYEDYQLLVQGSAPAVNMLNSFNSTFVREGGRTDSFEVQLDKMPSANVTVNFSSGSRINLSSNSLTFTPSNWYIKQAVTATAVNDGLSNGTTNEQITVTTSSADGTYNGLVVTPFEVQVLDNEVVDDSSVEIHLFSTSTANNGVDGDYAKVSGITSFGEFPADNFFGPFDAVINDDITTPTAIRYNYNNSLTSSISFGVDPVLTVLSSPTVLSLGDDELTSNIALPFDVMMYGQAMKYIKISSNGIIYLASTTIQATDTGNAQPWEGSAAMDLTLANRYTLTTINELMIAALWSDLTPASAGGAGTISYGVEGIAPNRVFVIYYNGVAPYDGTGGVNTSQVKFRESAIGPSAEVTVTAVVDPVISFTLTPSICNLGSLSSSEVKTCQFGIEVETNAAGGYTATIKDANNGSLLSGANNIPSSSVTLSSGTAGFGITSSSSTGNITNNATCSNASTRVVTGITSSDQIIVEGSEPTLSESTTICVGAIITDMTPAGSYSDVATVTVVGNF